MSPSTITLLFLLFAVVMFVLEKIPLGVTSMIVCCGLVVTGVLDVKIAFAGFIDSNVILFVAMFIVVWLRLVYHSVSSNMPLLVCRFSSAVLSFMQRLVTNYFRISKAAKSLWKR